MNADLLNRFQQLGNLENKFVGNALNARALDKLRVYFQGYDIVSYIMRLFLSSYSIYELDDVFEKISSNGIDEKDNEVYLSLKSILTNDIAKQSKVIEYFILRAEEIIGKKIDINSRVQKIEQEFNVVLRNLSKLYNAEFSENLLEHSKNYNNLIELYFYLIFVLSIMKLDQDAFVYSEILEIQLFIKRVLIHIINSYINFLITSCINVKPEFRESAQYVFSQTTASVIAILESQFDSFSDELNILGSLSDEQKFSLISLLKTNLLYNDENEA
ncbi:MAG: hypothetical protein KatS3mg090_0458 [Patescibacteria group bacterium]|nr:MAG: hypothetical protein KatS3mg090_0458 [Patescibacteria group bacterium]